MPVDAGADDPSWPASDTPATRPSASAVWGRPAEPTAWLGGPNLTRSGRRRRTDAVARGNRQFSARDGQFNYLAFVDFTQAARIDPTLPSSSLTRLSHQSLRSACLVGKARTRVLNGHFLGTMLFLRKGNRPAQA